MSFITRLYQNGARHDQRSIDPGRLLEMLKDGMDDLSAAIDTAKPATPEEEKLQLRWHHELGYLANQYRKLQRDTKLDEMTSSLSSCRRNSTLGVELMPRGSSRYTCRRNRLVRQRYVHRCWRTRSHVHDDSDGVVIQRSY